MELGTFFSILSLIHLMVQTVVLYNVMQPQFHRMADLLEHYPLALMEHWVVCEKFCVWSDCTVQMVTLVVQKGKVVKMVTDIVMHSQTDRMVQVVVCTVMCMVVDMLTY